MFSLKKLNKYSSPVCKIKGGQNNDKIIYHNKKGLFEDNKDEVKFYDFNKLLKNDLLKGLKKKEKLEKIRKIKEMIMTNKTPLRDDELYNKIKKIVDEDVKTELKIRDGYMNLLPSNTRDIIYVCGPSGVGKSTFCSEFVKQYMKDKPDNDLFLFSRKDEDPVFDKIRQIKRIYIDEELCEDPIDPTELAESLCIFDDTDTIRDKKLRNEVHNLKEDLMETGRDKNINMLVTSHLINNYKKTRSVLNELTKIVLFPDSTSPYSVKYCLGKYFGMDKKDIRRLFKLNSRWIIINKYPRYVIYEHGVYFLNNDNI